MSDVEYGGVGLRPFLTALIAEIITEHCMGVASSFGVSTVLGTAAGS